MDYQLAGILANLQGTRSKPSDGKRLRLLRFVRSRYAVCVADVCAFLRVGRRQAWRYIGRLQQEGLIYPRYRRGNTTYYSQRRRT